MMSDIMESGPSVLADAWKIVAETSCQNSSRRLCWLMHQRVFYSHLCLAAPRLKSLMRCAVVAGGTFVFFMDMVWHVSCVVDVVEIAEPFYFGSSRFFVTHTRLRPVHEAPLRSNAQRTALRAAILTYSTPTLGTRQQQG